MASKWIIYRDELDRVCAMVRIDEVPATGAWVENMSGMTLELPQTVEVVNGFDFAQDYKGTKLLLEGKSDEPNT